MREYDFVPLQLQVGPFIGTKMRDHQEIIQKRAQNGWYYDGYLPTSQSPHGQFLEIDLIFHRDFPDNE